MNILMRLIKLIKYAVKTCVNPIWLRFLALRGYDVCILRDAYIFKDQVYVSSEQYEKFKSEFDRDKYRYVKIARSGCLEAGDREIVTLRDYSLLLRCCSGNIGHFFNDHFYSYFVCYMRQNKIGIRRLNKILFPEVCSPNHFFLAKRSLFKKDQDKIIQLGEKIYYCEYLVIPPIDRNLTYREANKTLVSCVRENLWRSSGPVRVRNKTTKKVLIHQDTKSGRKILNLQELIAGLRIKGYEVKFIDGESWFLSRSAEECWKVYYETDVYIAPWGASFTNCISCKTGCKLILLKAGEDNGPFLTWYVESANGRKWSVEYLHTHELENKFHVMACEWKPWLKPDNQKPDWLLNEPLERTANLIADTDKILRIIGEKRDKSDG